MPPLSETPVPVPPNPRRPRNAFWTFALEAELSRAAVRATPVPLPAHPEGIASVGWESVAVPAPSLKAVIVVLALMQGPVITSPKAKSPEAIDNPVTDLDSLARF